MTTKASDVIKKLADLISKHGDLPVYLDFQPLPKNLNDIIMYEPEGPICVVGMNPNIQSGTKPMPEHFWIHWSK